MQLPVTANLSDASGTSRAQREPLPKGRRRQAPPGDPGSEHV